MSELQINTTQNVKITFNAAGAGERLLAFIIDMAIKIGYMLVLNWTFGAFDNMDQWSQIAINTVLSFPVMLYTLVLESVLQGQTIGKRILKIRVVKIDGYQASFSDYVVRWFFRIVDVYIFGLGFFVMLFNKKAQRIGDMAAGTAVIALKNNVNISHTILENLKDNYKPTYPNVIKLSDNDARIIKETFQVARVARDYQTLIKLRQKIIEVVGIKTVIQSNDVEFIDVILKDYNFYTQSM
ncbi:RDD family protein [Algibacter amylolyticus]|uniref:RDD family protein n=1 Tax=Algibacter amylolyticus TaxID=1608400 RepID=A0A5M7B6K0_9FLAO|nr:RDD family protein [Algibacter amylolyticus]KAA5823354.1 RDD family protein [Algibacter amylolyticus]MBB5267498.1 putative RDD family membrane protein YckC [Algibacter amylolyticus]TSJ73842.1 RDD family protein [Algibacter amylolyticus]